MFNKVFSFFASWFDKGLRLIQQAQAFGVWIWTVVASVLISLISMATFVVERINSLLLYLVGYLDSLRVSSDIVGGVQASTITFQSMLEIANTFFPVSELFAVMVSVAVIIGLCTVYGLVRSWLPSVFGIGFPTH